MSSTDEGHQVLNLLSQSYKTGKLTAWCGTSHRCLHCIRTQMSNGQRRWSNTPRYTCLSPCMPVNCDFNSMRSEPLKHEPNAADSSHIPLSFGSSSSGRSCVNFRPPQQPAAAPGMVQCFTHAPKAAASTGKHLQASLGLSKASQSSLSEAVGSMLSRCMAAQQRAHARSAKR